MTGINITQLKALVIRPVLAMLPPQWASATAVNLLAGTVLVESSGIYLTQLGGGPALGICQMEPITHNDCFATFLNYPDQAILKSAVLALLAPQPPSPLDQLPGNLFYAVAMARIKYIRAPDPLPNANDADGLADYHKTFYNSSLGATQVDASSLLFAQAIAA